MPNRALTKSVFAPCVLTKLLAAQTRNGTIDAIRQLFIRQLIVVAQVSLQFSQPALKIGGQGFKTRFAVYVVVFVRVIREIEQFPLILFPEIDQLVRPGPNAVVRSRIVVTGVVIVAIVHRASPVRRLAASKNR